MITSVVPCDRFRGFVGERTGMAVPLSPLVAIDADESTAEALGHWQHDEPEYRGAMNAT